MLENPALLSFMPTPKATVKGKFLYCGNEKLYIKGVTYGTFKPHENGHQFPEPAVVEKDFKMMAQRGINCVRTYTVPPAFLLDIAAANHLKIMVGLPWEQHITFLDTDERKKDIIKRVKDGVQVSQGHPAVLCYAIGNEIPAPIVRWYGRKKIERFLRQLFDAVKETDAASLVTYVNFPTTEYLNLSFLDFDCFNVYLETPGKLSAYIARLHNLAGDRPLVLAEIGLDSMRNGQQLQADTMAWQIKTAFSKGCAGMFVFAWTDEWWRGGFEIEDWDFGLVDRQRKPKPALQAVSQTMAEVPFADSEQLPFISVVVCSYNGSATIRDTMNALQKLDYPKYEVLVVNDGSKDNLAAIVKEYPVRLITTPNQGLSNARNTGLHAAEGEIVAYIDDDAYPDLQWLRYLATAYLSSAHGGIGGPNLVPPQDGAIAHCITNAPGGPVHVLCTDEIAEHIPGCNMSFRKKILLEIGGFDPVYRSAGDDVDICWRVQKAGYTIGFHPAALVWHHRRNSVSAYWKQQKGYGKAEALLEEKWPEKYNGFGHTTWQGRIYGNGFTLPINLKKGKVFYGSWGSALFQSIYQPANGFILAIPLMPEWYLITGLVTMLALFGILWHFLLWVWVLVFLCVAVIIVQAVISAIHNVSLEPKRKNNAKYTALIILLHIIQPMARLYGRIKHGLTPWRKFDLAANLTFAFVLRPRYFTLWFENWESMEDRLTAIESSLRSHITRVQRGGDFDRWDLQVRNGFFSKSQGLLTIEEHGGGRQLLRFKIWPVMPVAAIVSITILLVISWLALTNHIESVPVIFVLMALLIAGEFFKESACTMYHLYAAFKSLELKTEEGSVATATETEQELDAARFTNDKGYTESVLQSVPYTLSSDNHEAGDDRPPSELINRF